VRARLKQAIKALRRDAVTVWLLARDRRVPLVARGTAILTAAYAFSPIDLVPDFIPVLGLVDDLLIVPLGLWLALRLAPDTLIAQARARADRVAQRPVSRGGIALVVLTWLLVLSAACFLLIRT
jgi:uncharacterized membrane protein YkvA (DUF1232 family)